MQFALFAITLKDFKCFYGTHEFEFPTEAGLYYLTGQNDFNNRLGANGTGKSSIIDGINWCFYGKTSRGLRANDIVSWGKKKSSVSVTVLVGETEVEITRSQNPNKISINDEPASQEEVTKLIGLNQDAFNASVVIPQFGESFFDLSPSRKLEIFSQVMNLDYWLEKSERASKQASLVTNNIAVLSQGIERNEGKRDGLQANIKEYKLKSHEFEAQLKDESKALSDEIKRSKRSIKAASSSLKKNQKLKAKVAEELTELKDLLEYAANEFSKLSDKVSSYTVDIKTNDRHLEDLNSDLTAFEELKGITCPTCKQKVDKAHVGKHQSKLIGKINSIDAENSTLQKKLSRARDKQNDARSDTLKLNNLKTEINNRVNDYNHLISNCERDIKDSTSKIARFEKDIKDLQNKPNPFAEMIATAKRRRKQLSIEVQGLSGQLEEEKAKHAAYTYWVGGFKRVRLFVIEEALHSLEYEVNNLLISLGLIDWKITFDVERETKAGGISKGFTVFIQSPKHDKPVRFESWSGGETQRLRLAGDLGLANLIMEQAGLVNTIEMIDEPSTHMSQQGIEDLLDTLHQRAHSTGKQIWIVDHHSVEFSGFTGTLTAIMDDKGRSHLEYKG